MATWVLVAGCAAGLLAGFVWMREWHRWTETFRVIAAAGVAGACAGALSKDWVDIVLVAVMFSLFTLLTLLKIGPGPASYARSPKQIRRAPWYPIALGLSVLALIAFIVAIDAAIIAAIVVLAVCATAVHLRLAVGNSGQAKRARRTN